MTTRRDPSPTASGVFDEHLANHYDQTRALGESAMAELVDRLVAELSGHARCLEIGIGTGRIAAPLVEAGVSMVGIDPSVPMLARLREKAPQGAPLDLLRADATALPFVDASFGAGLVCHVLHLIREWESALLELVRVVRRPGLILIEHAAGSGGGVASELRTYFHEAAGVPPFGRLGVRDPALVDAALARFGARSRELSPVVDETTTTVATTIDHLELGIHSSNADLPAEVRRRAAAATRQWALRRYGSLDEPVRREREIIWRAYQL